jgi:hypothetical protein
VGRPSSQVGRLSAFARSNMFSTLNDAMRIRFLPMSECQLAPRPYPAGSL